MGDCGSLVLSSILSRLPSDFCINMVIVDLTEERKVVSFVVASSTLVYHPLDFLYILIH